MASTYVNDLRLNEMATGDASGTWGTVTNTNLELIGEALGYGTEGITTNADTHTTTVADGATDPGRAMYIEYTGTLDSACTITIAPNTLNRMHFIENGTSGSQNIIIKQGSGATITIPPGDTKAVYLDGAGSGAAVVDAFASLNVVDLKVQDDLTLTSDSAVITFGVDGDTTLTHTDGSGLTLNSTNKIMFNDASQFIQGSSATVLALGATDEIDLTATAIDVNGTMDVSGAITSSAGATITTADNTTQLTLISTDADAAVGPVLDLYRNSSSPADNDNVGQINWFAENDADEKIKFAEIRVDTSDVSNGSEDARVLIQTATAGGIGTSRLEILPTESVFNQDSVDVDFRVESDNLTHALFLQGSDGRVGIGTDSPDAILEVVDAGAAAPGTALKVYSNQNSAATDGLVFIHSDQDVAPFTALNVRQDGTGDILNLLDGTTEVFTVLNGGNVGIGEAAPHERLHVTGPSGNAILLHMDADTADGTSSLLFKNDSTNTDVRIKGGIIFQRDDPGTRGTGDLHLCVNGVNSDTNVAVSDAKLSIFANGVVTIGNLNFTGTGSDSLINAGNVIFNVSGGILTSGSTSLDLQFQVPVTGVGTSTAAKLDAPSGDWFTNDGSVSSLSDSRLKKDITTLTDGIDIVKQLRPVTFKYDDTTRDEDGSKHLGAASETVRYGFVAQEVESVASQYVASREGKVKGETVSDLKSLSQTRMIPMLVKSIQELESRITTLEG